MHNLYTILQVMNLTVFEKIPLLQMFIENDYKISISPNHEQLHLFD